MRRVIPGIMDDQMHIDQYILVHNYVKTVSRLLKPDERAICRAFNAKFKARIETRSEDIEKAKLAAKIADRERRAQEQEEEKRRKYAEELTASGLMKAEFDRLAAESRAKKKERIKEKNEEAKRELAAKTAAKAKKQLEPGYDEYDFDEGVEIVIDEPDGKDFLSVPLLTEEQEQELIDSAEQEQDQELD